MNTRYDVVIFDLDGTLLDTLDDLTNACNHALRTGGYAEHTNREVCSYIGDGVRQLILRALPQDARDDATIDATLALFKTYYAQHNDVCTAPYAGVEQMLDRLAAAGVRVAVVSNKDDRNVKRLCQAYFGSRVPLAVGERESEGVRRKPWPDSVLYVMQQCDADSARTLYVGDSEVDVQTARNAGVDCAAVLWGFRTEQRLREAGARYLFGDPQALTDWILQA